MPSIRSHPLKHQDFSSLQELPDCYTWTQHGDDLDHSAISESVPVIDLSDPNSISLIGHACKTWGVFQVINHGILSTLFDKIESLTDSLFSLPSHQKIKASRTPDCPSGYGVARIASFFEKQFWSEGFTILGSPVKNFSKLCDEIKEYEDEMKKLAGRLMLLMLNSLGITEEDVKWAGPKGDFNESSAAIQLNHYPACPDPDRAMGIAPHTDSTLLTILYQNSTTGLQVFKEGTGWVTVPPIPGGLVINLGDLFHILSNGLYPSVIHRAKVNRNRKRFSVVYLFGPPSNVAISPLQKLVGPTQPPLYRPVTWQEYLGTKAKHFNKALKLCSLKNGWVDVNDQDNSVTVG